jgi:hypothetical protein
MTRLFRIEDELHAEPMAGDFASFEEALSEVRRLASVPWGEHPNVAPCQSSATCGRHYEIVEYDTSTQPYWTEQQRTSIVEIMKDGAKWEWHEAT